MIKPEIIPIILAAGESKRMGFPKILAKIDGKCFGDIIINKLQKTHFFAKIIIVLGHNHNIIAPHFSNKKNVKIIVNQAYKDGPLSSLKCALKYIKNPVSILMWPVDHPLVKLDTLLKMLNSWKNNINSIIVPSYNFKRGHPVIFDKYFFDELLNAELNLGAKSILKKFPKHIIHINTNDTGIIKNINSPNGIDIALKF